MFLEDLREKLENYELDLPGGCTTQTFSTFREYPDLEEVKDKLRIAAVLIMLYENEEGNIEFPLF